MKFKKKIMNRKGERKLKVFCSAVLMSENVLAFRIGIISERCLSIMKSNCHTNLGAVFY